VSGLGPKAHFGYTCKALKFSASYYGGGIILFSIDHAKCFAYNHIEMAEGRRTADACGLGVELQRGAHSLQLTEGLTLAAYLQN
jgi:hypothetical protein